MVEEVPLAGLSFHGVAILHELERPMAIQKRDSGWRSRKCRGWRLGVERLESRRPLTWVATPLGRLPGMVYSTATDLSDDESVVTGVSGDDVGHEVAFRWTAAGGMQSLGTFGGESSRAYAISGDGRVIVGSSTDASGNQVAFRWTEQTGMQPLGIPEGWSHAFSSSAQDVSPDGTVIVGAVGDTAMYSEVFRWTGDTGMQVLVGSPAIMQQQNKSVSMSRDGGTLALLPIEPAAG